MPIYCYEKALASEAVAATKGSSYSTTWIVSGTTSEYVAQQTALAASPVAVTVESQVLVRQRAKAKPLVPDAWEVDLDYGPEDDPESKPPPTPGYVEIEFDTGGGQTKVTQSISTIARYSWNQGAFPAPDLKGAINWDGKQVKGTEVGHPALKLDITAYYAAGHITQTFLASLARNTWRTNENPWLGFQKGEVLFIGGKGKVDVPLISGPRAGVVAMKLTFECSENATNLVINNQITIARKDGWHYLWAKYHEEADAIVGPVPRPEYMFVEQLYKELNFATFFGFGGP